MKHQSRPQKGQSRFPDWLVLALFVPITAIAALYSWPKHRHDKKKLEHDIHYRWIPEEKYLYLTYTKGTILGKIMEQDVIPKYSKYLVTDSWNKSAKAHVTTKGFEGTPNLMNSAFIEDYDGAYEAALVRIDAFTGAKLALTTYEIEDEADANEVVSKMTKEINECLDAWTQEKHRSGLRTLLAESGDDPYHAILDFNSAKNNPKAYAIMEGDSGGQVYLTVPMTKVECGEVKLKKLLKEIDSRGWNDPVDATLYFEEIEAGLGEPGGMGGGLTDNKLWIHPKLAVDRKVVEDYLAGKISTIIAPTSHISTP